MPAFSLMWPAGAPSVTVVASSSVMVTVWLFVLPSLASAPAVRSTVKASAGSSVLSSVRLTLMSLLLSAALNTRSVL